jgi:hypothetical protein
MSRSYSIAAMGRSNIAAMGRSNIAAMGRSYNEPLPQWAAPAAVPMIF